MCALWGKGATTQGIVLLYCSVAEVFILETNTLVNNLSIMSLYSQGVKLLCLMTLFIKCFGDCLVTRIAKNW